MAATPRQHQAITRHDMSMVVTAGAGTGKTFVLVEKYLNLIQDEGFRIRDVLALTFTDKAAAEMKERVRKTIADRLRADPENQIWKDAHEELVIAPIMTFHSFCAQILREFAIEAGLDPGFVILDEGQNLAVQREAFDTLVRKPPGEIYEPLVRLLAQVEKYQLYQILTSISTESERFSQFCADITSDPDGIINTWEIFLEQVRTPVIKEFFQNGEVRDAIADFIRFEKIYQNTGDRAAIYLTQVCSSLKRIRADVSLEELSKAVREFLSVRPKGTLGSQKIWNNDDLKLFRREKTFLIEKLEKTLPYFELYIKPDSAFTTATMSFFFDLALVGVTYMSALQALKKQANGLDFNDLITCTREFLHQHQDIVARHIRPRFRYILVDEFQDTDPSQFEIITSIIGDLTPETKGLFIVGDPKQSIYLFRNADVTRFKEAQNRILTDCNGDLINLDTSFRSCREVIGCVNYLFSRIFSSTEKPWEFGYEPIQVCEERKRSSGSITVLMPEKAPKGSEQSESKEIEAGMVADLVHRIVSSGSFLITDRDNVIRPAGYGDIAILIERRTHLSRYTTALSRKEAPYYVHGGIGFYSRQEIYDIYSILSFLLRPFDTAALYGVLRSPYFGLSDIALFHILHIHESKKGWTLFDTLKIIAQELTTLSGDKEEQYSCFSSSDREKIIRAFSLLNSWKKHAGREPVVSFISRIIRESGIFTIYSAMEQGEQQVANLLKLQRIIKRKTESGAYNLFDLISDMTVSIADEEREGEAALDTLSKTSVNIMTVHAAKGLEFPIVILPDMGSSREGKLGPILSGDHTAIFGVKIPDPDHDYEIRETPVYSALSLIQKEKESAERKRLFYVGTTRARDHLILCGKQPEKYYDTIDKSNNRIDWICTIFGITKEIAEQGGVLSFDPKDGGDEIEVTVLSDPDQLTRIWADEKLPPLIIPDEFITQSGTRIVKSQHSRERVIHRPVPVTDAVESRYPEPEIKDFVQQINIPDAPTLQKNEAGILLHQIFSGKSPQTVLAKYGITSLAAEIYCTSLYEQFCSLPLIQDSSVSYQELSFVTYIGPYPVTGRIDRLIQISDGTWAVIDYKSGNNSGAEWQLNFYRKAAERITGQTVRMFVYSIQTGKMTEAPCLSDEEMIQYLKEWTDSHIQKMV
ncbi:ATP-dependent helicase/nuclease subunit A [anaerobic digester metagenome]